MKVSEWKDIVHYGCNLSGENKAAACLQDGIAPQSNIQGLSSKSMFIFQWNFKKNGLSWQPFYRQLFVDFRYSQRQTGTYSTTLKIYGTQISVSYQGEKPAQTPSAPPSMFVGIFVGVANGFPPE